MTWTAKVSAVCDVGHWDTVPRAKVLPLLDEMRSEWSKLAAGDRAEAQEWDARARAVQDWEVACEAASVIAGLLDSQAGGDAGQSGSVTGSGGWDDPYDLGGGNVSQRLSWGSLWVIVPVVVLVGWGLQRKMGARRVKLPPGPPFG